MEDTSGGSRRTVPLSERLRRGDLMSEACPSREVLKHVTSRWGVLVLMALEGGTRRFSELRRMIGGVSERMLAQTLQWLEADGLIDRVAYPVVPPHVEYSLSPLGVGAAARPAGVMEALDVALGVGHQAEDAPGRIADAGHGAGRSVGVLRVRVGRPPGRVALPAVESFGQCPCAIRVHRVPISVELGARGLLDR